MKPSLAGSSRPRIQLALDFPGALACVQAVRPWVDLVEVGTPLLKRFGLSIVSTVRELAAGLPVLADSKTVDGGAQECAMLTDAGADLITVLACASAATFEAADTVARRYGTQIVADAIASPDPRPALIRDYPASVSGVALHVSFDTRAAGVGHTTDLFAHDLPKPGRDLVVAGGIDMETLSSVLRLRPQVLVVGRAITTAPNPAAAARAIAEAVQ